MSDKDKKTTCYCYSNKSFEACCAPFIEGSDTPKTPEQLMRSRYSAFVLKNMDYIEKTMKGKALQKADLDQTKLWIEHVKWIGLDIVKTKINEPNDGMVHFIAHYEENGEPHQLEEVSQFKKISGVWYYTQGKKSQPAKQNKTAKVGRNDPCPCNSGKKYKHCCGLK